MPRKRKGQKADKQTGFAGHTHAVFVLDRTGSMSSIAKQAVDGFNEWLDSLRGYDRVTVDAYMFDSHPGEPTVQCMFRDHTADSAPRIVNAQYGVDMSKTDRLPFIPRGMTPLYDAVGEVLSTTPVPADGDRLLVAIMTDGEENASREWTQDRVRQIVQDREMTGRVTIAFMIGGLDTADARVMAASMGSSTPGTAKGFVPDALGTRGASHSTVQATASYMSSAAGATPDFYEPGGSKPDGSKPDETLEEQVKRERAKPRA